MVVSTKGTHWSESLQTHAVSGDAPKAPRVDLTLAIIVTLLAYLPNRRRSMEGGC
jgi:hypothetical protein